MKPNMMQLSKFIKWSVTGDGCVSYATHNKDAHYSITRAREHEDYLYIIKDKFTNLQNCTVTIDSYTRKDNGKEVLSLRTSSHPIFTRVRDRQYIKNHRVLDPHQMSVLDWESMAFLYMDDGSLCKNVKGYPIVRLSTCAYSYAEQMFLRLNIIEKLGVTFNINKTGKSLYQLNLAKNSFDTWFSGISSFIVSSYKYKLP